MFAEFSNFSTDGGTVTACNLCQIPHVTVPHAAMVPLMSALKAAPASRGRSFEHVGARRGHTPFFRLDASDTRDFYHTRSGNFTMRVVNVMLVRVASTQNGWPRQWPRQHSSGMRRTTQCCLRASAEIFRSDTCRTPRVTWRRLPAAGGSPSKTRAAARGGIQASLRATSPCC